MTDGCFLIGCGPSLNKIDVALLAHHHTITFNRAYVAWDKWGFTPNYYACFDMVTLATYSSEIRGLITDNPHIGFFLNERALDYGIYSTNQVTLIQVKEGTTFSTDLLTVTDFGNVGASSLQILAALKYRRVVLVGVDARYNLRNTDHCKDVKGLLQHDNFNNHFSCDYEKSLPRFVEPDLQKILGQWPNVASECRRLGLEVRNASPGSALTSFPMISFEDALVWIDKGA